MYIDKTDLMWEMTQMKYVFLSRPRRFGKSLLSSTLHSYFDGQRDLFEGLKIMELEQDWEQYPVIHVDLSTAKNMPTASELQRVLLLMLEPLTEKFGRRDTEITPGDVLGGMIRRAYEKTGKQVAIVIDEYDAPLLDVLHEEVVLPEFRRVMQEFYKCIKAAEPMVRFCFITGITKFSQLSIFSTINNLTNISLDDKYAALCGITEQEFATDMAPDIAMLAGEYECTPEEMHARLKRQYDGYRFSGRGPEVYNPFSLMKCFNQRKMDNYWFTSGTPTFLIRQMQHFRTDITTLEKLEVPSTAFDRPTEAMTNALPYLTEGRRVVKVGIQFDRDTMTVKDYLAE